ncbi:MAG: FAD-dependent oxidoreductase, partial [Planctomycetota bacterium]
MPATFDCIVLGLGGIGSATLAALARRGVRVLGIDRFSPPHEYGSSHGETRVIRRAYPEHPDYVPLVDRAFRQWRELESETGRELLTRTGLLLTGPRDGDTIDGSLRAAAQHQLDIVEIPRGETRDRFPHLR